MISFILLQSYTLFIKYVAEKRKKMWPLPPARYNPTQRDFVTSRYTATAADSKETFFPPLSYILTTIKVHNA